METAQSSSPPQPPCCLEVCGLSCRDEVEDRGPGRRRVRTVAITPPDTYYQEVSTGDRIDADRQGREGNRRSDSEAMHPFIGPSDLVDTRGQQIRPGRADDGLLPGIHRGAHTVAASLVIPPARRSRSSSSRRITAGNDGGTSQGDVAGLAGARDGVNDQEILRHTQFPEGLGNNRVRQGSRRQGRSDADLGLRSHCCQQRRRISDAMSQAR